MSIYSMKRNFKKRWLILKELWQPFFNHNTSTYASAASFYILLSVLPTTALILTVLQQLPISISYWQQLLNQILPNRFHAVTEYLFNAAAPKHSAVLISGWAILSLWSASKGILSITKGLSSILSVSTNSGYIRRRLEAMASFILLSAVLIISMTVHIFGQWLVQRLSVVIPIASLVYHFRFLYSLFLLSILFLFLYRFLPGIHLPFRFCLVSGVFTAAAWILASSAFSVYVNHFQSYQFRYGSLGLLVLCILWLQISMNILLFSVLLTKELFQKSYRPFQILKRAFGKIQ